MGYKDSTPPAVGNIPFVPSEFIDGYTSSNPAPETPVQTKPEKKPSLRQFVSMDGTITMALPEHSAPLGAQGGDTTEHPESMHSTSHDDVSSIPPAWPPSVRGQDTRAHGSSHVCPMCKTQFTRLEHLKRHINSLHGERNGQSHDCQFCSKQFFRKDILLRHYLSCRAARVGDEPAQPFRKRAKRACKTCNELKLRCSGGTQCERCSDLNQECFYPPRRKRTVRQNQAAKESWSSHSPSAPLDAQHSNTHAASLNPTDDAIRNHSTTESHAQASEVQPQPNSDHLTTQIIDYRDFTRQDKSPGYQQHRFPTTEPSQTAALDPTLANDQPSKIGYNEGQVQRKDTAIEDVDQDVRARKRGAYVSTACTNCQKRKIKCSGDEICIGCQSSGSACVYKSGRERRRITAKQKPAHGTANENNPIRSANEPKLSDSLSSIMERIAKLERDNYALKARVENSTVTVDDDSHSSSGYTSDNDDTTVSESDGGRMTIDGIFVHGPTSLLEPIEVLNRTVAGVDSEASTSPESKHESQDADRASSSLPRGGNRTIRTLEKETRLYDMEGLTKSLDVFFTCLNPHYPCLNENQFRTQFQEYLSLGKGHNPPNHADRHQFVALINLICAEVKVLSGESHESHSVSGWDEFCRAEEILSHFTWLGDGNLLTVQCLIIKARYLLYIDKANAAYDTMSRVVRLCFRIGLNNQTSWTNCTPFEVAMRQRIFWTVFYLERNLALTCGMPYLIRASDFKVDLPMNLDDHFMSPTEPLPVETPERSYAPYLSFIVKWGELSSEIWDAIFGVNAQKPTSQEFVASMDGRILYTISQIPLHLQWQHNLHRLDTATDVPKYIIRQTAILHLRMNRLRLLLRQENLLSLNYGSSMANECLKIAENSIDVVYTHLSSNSVYGPTERWASVFNITVALLPLVCIIVKSDNEVQTRSDAITAYEKGLGMLQQLALNFSNAARILQRLNRIIETTNQAITWFQNSEAESMLMDQHLFEMQTVVPQLSEFFGHDLNLDSNPDLGQQLHSGMPYSLNNLTMEPTLLGVTGDMNAFWSNESYKNSIDDSIH